MADIMDMDWDMLTMDMDILIHMDIWDIGAERGDLLKQNLLLILRLILIFFMVDIMDMVMVSMEDTMDTLMLTGVNKEECQKQFLNISTLTRIWANIGTLNYMFYTSFLFPMFSIHAMLR